MKRWIVGRMLDRFARQWNYDVSYMRAMAEASPTAFRKFAAIGHNAETSLRVSLGAVESRGGMAGSLRRLRDALAGEVAPQVRGFI